MFGCLVFSLPVPRIRSPSRPVQVEKIQFGRQGKNVGYRLMLEIEFSLTHGKSSSCGGQNSFVASTSVSKAGALHSFMHVNHLKVERQLESSFQPNRLPAESKFLATEISPTRLNRKAAHFGK